MLCIKHYNSLYNYVFKLYTVVVSFTILDILCNSLEYKYMGKYDDYAEV